LELIPGLAFGVSSIAVLYELFHLFYILYIDSFYHQSNYGITIIIIHGDSMDTLHTVNPPSSMVFLQVHSFHAAFLLNHKLLKQKF